MKRRLPWLVIPALLLLPLLVAPAASAGVKTAGATAVRALTTSGSRPAITRLAPTTAKRLAKVTITGRNFGASRGASYVKFGAKKCTTYLKWSATKIVCKVPAAAAADKVQVTVTARRRASKSKPFIVIVPPPRGAWTAVSGGVYHSLGIMHDGSLWAWGSNGGYALGLGDTIARRVPTRVGAASDWAAVSCGGGWNLAIRRDGSLWAWGANSDGCLGLGATVTRSTPTRVGIASDWAAVSCGYDHALAVKTDGSLWAWGANGTGELGLGHTDSIASLSPPTRVGTGSDWALVSAGAQFSHALKRDGSLWAWGGNLYGALGIGDPNIIPLSVTPTRVGSEDDWVAISSERSSHTLALRSDGSLWAWGDAIGMSGQWVMLWLPTQLGTETDWAAICGAQSYFACKADGSLWGWGNNPEGEDDTPSRVGSATDWAGVSGSGSHKVALKRDGSLWAWGNNLYGQLGVGTVADHSTPVRVGGP